MALSREQMIQEMKLADMREALKQDDLRQSRVQEPMQVNDEMPEWVADTDRLKAKNLTNNVDEQVAFLQKQYPDADVMKQGDRVLLRKKGESAYGVLDPSFSVGKMFSKEGLRDAGDILSDIGQGAAEAAGATIGAPLGLGGIMGGSAVAAGAASSAKEKLAEMLGVKEADYMNAAKDAAIGGLAPGVLNVAGKGIKYGVSKAAPKLYSKLLGLTEDGLRAVGDDAAMASIENKGVTGHLEDIGHDVRGALNSEKESAVRELEAAMGTQATVPIKSARDTFEVAIKQEGSRGFKNRLSAERIAALNEAKDSIFQVAKKDASNLPALFDENGINIYKNMAPESIPDSVSVKDAFDLQQMINSEYGDYGKQAISMGQHRAGKGNGSNELVERVAMMSADQLNKHIDEATKGLSSAAKADYRKYLLSLKEIAPKFKDAATIERSLKQMTSGRSQVQDELLNRLEDKYKVNITKRLNQIDAYNFVNPAKESGFKAQAKNIAIGNTPVEHGLAILGGFTGYMSGGGYAGSALGSQAGRWLGKGIASPKTVKAFLKTQGMTEAKMKSIEEIIKRNPWLLQSLYGGAAAATQD